LQLNRLTARIGALFFVLAAAGRAAAQPIDIPLPALELGVRAAEGPADVALTLQIVALLTVLSLAPAIVVMLTSFTHYRRVVVRAQRAVAAAVPPNQVLIGLALFLTMFTMAPTWQELYTEGLQPYLAGS
jgi:Flagellar biosynthesis pathway, component FliP